MKGLNRFLCAIMVLVILIGSMPLLEIELLKDMFSTKAYAAVGDTKPVYTTNEKELFEALGFDPYNVFSDVSLDGGNIELPSVYILGKEYSLGSLKGSINLPLNHNIECNVDFDKKTIEIIGGYERDESTVVKPEKDPYWRTSYYEMKDFFNKVIGKQPKGLWNKFSSLRGDLKELKCSMGFEITAKIGLYAQFSFENNELDLKEGGVVLGAKAEVDFYTPVAPVVYVGLGLEPSVDGKFGLKEIDDGVTVAGEIEGKFEGSGYLGLGAKTASSYIEAGIKGYFKGVYNIPSSSLREAMTLSFGGDLYAESKIFGIAVFEATHPLLEFQVFPRKEKFNTQSVFETESIVNTSTLFESSSLVERDYTFDNFSISDEFRLQDIYSETEAELVTLSNGNLMLIWIGDDGTKNIENRTSVFYSIFDGNTWSESKVVCDNNEYNCSPKAVVYEDQVYLTWQKSEINLDDGESLTDILAKSELYYSIFDGESFSDARPLKNQTNTVAEFGQDILADDNGFYVSWYENSENNVYFTSGNNSIKYVYVNNNGTISEPVDVIATNHMIIDYEMIISDGVVKFIYSTKNNGVNKMYLYDGVNVDLLAESETELANIEVYNSNSFAYLNGHLVESYDLNSKDTKNICDYPVRSFELLEDEEGNLCLITTGYADDMYSVYISEFDDANQKFNEFESQYVTEKYINDYTGTLKNGECFFALKTSVFDINAESVFSDYELFVTDREDYYEIEVADFAWSNDNIVTGEKITIGFDVINKGNQSVDNFKYTLTDLSDNSIVGSGTIDESICAGEEKTVYAEYVVPLNFTSTNIRVDVELEDKEWDTSDNYAIVELGQADLILEDVEQEYRNGTFIVSGIVRNNGWTRSENNVIKVYDSTVGGELIYENTIKEIPCDSSVGFEFVLSDEYAYAADEDEFHSIYIVISSTTTETQISNNEYHLVYNDDFWQELISSNDSFDDVIIAEEMFEGFSKSLIINVADVLFNFEDSVNVAEYRLKTEEDVIALFAAIQKYYPAEYTALLSTTDFSFRVVSSPSLDIITNIRFYYGEDIDMEAFERRAKDINEEISDIVEKVDGFDDFEKALYIHDYIVLHCEYDLELADYIDQNGGIIVGSEYYNERYTDYSVLVNGTGVCDSYATAYRALMNASGVECVYVSSNSMNHAWNEIKLDGQWYHVDCTWDDPVPDNYGTAGRTYFLLNDAEMKSLNHHSWTPSNYVSKSTTYSEMPRNVDRTQKYDYENDLWYYYENGKVCRTDRWGDNAENVCSLNARTIALDDGKLYYSNGRSVYRYDIDADSSEIVYVLPSSKSGEVLGRAYLKNMYIHGENITYYKVIVDENDKLITVYGEAVFNGDDYVSVNQTGTCGENSVWKIVNGTDLFIEGSGEITDTAWNSFSANVLSITVSDDITYIPEGAFSGINNLKSISIPFVGSNKDANNTYDAVFGYIFGKSTDEFGVVQFYILEGSSLSGYRYAIPDKLESVTVTNATQIPFGAFYNCNMIKDISINEGVKQIGIMSFWGCSGIKSFVVPNSVQTIGQSAFENVNSLESLVIPFVGHSRDSNNSFEAPLGYIFGGSESGTAQYIYRNGTQLAYNTYNIPSSLKYVTVTDADIIPFGAFCNCKNIEEIVINEGVASIGEYAFHNTAIKKFVVPNSVMRIDEDAFNGCESLVELKLPFVGQTRDSVDDYDAVFGFIFGRTSAGTKQFVRMDSQYLYSNTYAIPSALKKVTVTDDSDISFGAFSNTQLEEIIFSESTVSIDNYAFKGVNRLNKLMILNANCEMIDEYGSVTLTGTIYGLHNSKIQDFAKNKHIDFVVLTMIEKENSTVCIDYNNKLAYGFSSGLNSVKFENDYVIVSAGLNVAFTGEMGTGTVVSFNDAETGELVDEYTILIFGDVNGDSWYDGQDAVLVSCLANGMLTKDDVSEAVYMAADCNHDGVIDQLDVDLLNQAGTLLANVDQSKPTEVLLETSSAYVEYLDLIDQSPEIEVEDETDTEIDTETDAEQEETPEADVDTTPEQDEIKTETSIFEMIINFIKSIFEMLFAYIPVPLK